MAIILTIFAIGAQYAHLESPRHPPNNNRAPEFSEENVGATFYRNAIRLLPEIIEISSLESVQACLLFGIYALPVDASGLGYIYTNLAIRLGMQNGMHRKCRDRSFSDKMTETRNRVWWTAYSLERCASQQCKMTSTPSNVRNRKISIFHGRPLSVIRLDIDADLPKCQDADQGKPLHIARAIASLQLVHFLEDFFSQMQVISGLITRTSMVNENAI